MTDNGNISEIAGDGVGTKYGSLWLTLGGFNTSEQKQLQAIWIRPNHDAETRLKFNNTAALFNKVTASSTIKIAGLASTPTFTGTYKIFGRK